MRVLEFEAHRQASEKARQTTEGIQRAMLARRRRRNPRNSILLTTGIPALVLKGVN